MVQILAWLADDLPRFAPEMISDPRVCLFRIYRDTRFSADKSPLKTQAAAHFPTKGFARGEGAGLYFEVAPQWVWIGGGLYRPAPADLQIVREEIAARHPRLHRIVTAPPFRNAVGTLQGESLTRVPRGFPADHPAATYLKFKQFVAGREFDAEFAVSPRFYPELLRTFQALVPLVRFLNAPLQRGRVQGTGFPL